MTPLVRDIEAALAELGGKAPLAAIYRAVEARRARLPASWKASVRAQIERHSSDSSRFGGKSDLFRRVGPKGSGVWALRQVPASKPRRPMLRLATPVRSWRLGGSA